MDEQTSTIFATVGTDYHPFSRLFRWIDMWRERHQSVPARWIVQHGSAAPPANVTRYEYVPFGQMERLMADADIVICHGGPCTIDDASRAGKRPIVIPRDCSLGEHVDNHQIEFSHHLASRGLISLAEDFATFDSLITDALNSPYSARQNDLRSLHRRGIITSRSIERFVEEVALFLK